MSRLPRLTEDLLPTRDYLRETALVLGSLQRGFLPEHPRHWEHGLEVTMRGLSTQPFSISKEAVRASLDLIRHKVRLGGRKWPLHENSAPEIMHHVEAWLKTRGVTTVLDEPDFAGGVMLYDTAQAEAYAEALWWMDEQFRRLKASLQPGTTSPILLYPHHFDLSMVWFPWDDGSQFGLGWSTGDAVIPESYVYLTAYPGPRGFTKLPLPQGAHWQTKGFSGAILPYAALQNAAQPESVLDEFVLGLFHKAIRYRRLPD